MIPAIHSTRLAVSPFISALMIGIPPATDASKPMGRVSASSKSALPSSAMSALFAVMTGVRSASAVLMTSAAVSTPPISSTTTSTSLPERERRSVSKLARPMFTPGFGVRLATRTSSSRRPARAANASASSTRIFATELPTVPSPASPILRGGSSSADFPSDT